jgi:hypothetical protein
MKQVCFPKGTTTGDISKEKGREDANRYAFSGTALQPLPLPPLDATLTEALQTVGRTRRPFGLSERASVASTAQVSSRTSALSSSRRVGKRPSLRATHDARARPSSPLQEEIDWLVYARLRTGSGGASRVDVVRGAGAFGQRRSNVHFSCRPRPRRRFMDDAARCYANSADDLASLREERTTSVRWLGSRRGVFDSTRLSTRAYVMRSCSGGWRHYTVRCEPRSLATLSAVSLP